MPKRKVTGLKTVTFAVTYRPITRRWCWNFALFLVLVAALVVTTLVHWFWVAVGLLFVVAGWLFYEILYGGWE